MPKKINSEDGKVNRWVHPVRQKLKQGERVVGLTLTVASPELAARGAAMGFDFLWIEMEHSPITLETARNMILAARSYPAPPFIRVPVNERWWAKRVMDTGATGVIFPFTSSRELAEQAAQACRYPLKGLRGSGAGLASFSWKGAGSYYDSADQNMMVVTVVEDRPGLDAIEQIASTPGIDVIFIGTSDLSFALGQRGNMRHPEVQQAIKKIARAALKAGKVVGRPAKSAEEMHEFEKEGFKFFQTLPEIGLMELGAAQVLKKSAGSKPGKPMY